MNYQFVQVFFQFEFGRIRTQTTAWSSDEPDQRPQYFRFGQISPFGNIQKSCSEGLGILNWSKIDIFVLLSKWSFLQMAKKWTNTLEHKRFNNDFFHLKLRHKLFLYHFVCRVWYRWNGSHWTQKITLWSGTIFFAKNTISLSKLWFLDQKEWLANLGGGGNPGIGPFEFAFCCRYLFLAKNGFGAKLVERPHSVKSRSHF